MSYNTQAQLARDEHFRDRLAACAATQQIENPVSWAEQNVWTIAAAPGLDDAYEYAVNAGFANPGKRADSITDAMILSAVQAFINRVAAQGGA